MLPYFGPSGVRVLPLGFAAELWDYFLFSSLFCATYFSPRRGCPGVMKFCTDFQVTHKLRFGVKQNLGPQ